MYMHPLEQARTERGLTRAALARQAGVATSTIAAIEQGSDYKTNNDTASRIVRALGDVNYGDIFRPEDVSHIGRPPASGKPCVRQPSRPATVCPACRLTVPATGICDECEKPVALTA